MKVGARYRFERTDGRPTEEVRIERAIVSGFVFCVPSLAGAELICLPDGSVPGLGRLCPIAPVPPPPPPPKQHADITLDEWRAKIRSIWR